MADDFFASLQAGLKFDRKQMRSSYEKHRVELQSGEDAKTINKPDKILDNNAFRKKHNIYVHGHGGGVDIPGPLRSFESLEDYGVADYISANLKRAEITEPTPVQMQSIPVLLEGRDIMGCSATGSGKTIAFTIPLLTQLDKPKKKGFRAVILSPTKELANQIERELRFLAKGRNFRIVSVDRKSKDQDFSNSKSTDICIATPLRLISLLKRNAISLDNVEYLVLDEADRLLHESFLEQTGLLLDACKLPKITRALFSATIPEGVEELARVFLRDPVRIDVGVRNVPNSLIGQELLFVGEESGKLTAIRQLITEGLTPPVLCFVQSKDRAEELYQELVYEDVRVDVIHAGRNEKQRQQAVKRFRLGQTWFLIATDVMARGVDFKGVSTIINYDLPQSATAYIHRIGRTGRMRKGRAVTLYTLDDREFLRPVANVMKQSGCKLPDWMFSLKKLRKDEKKRLEDRPTKRRHISTRPGFDVSKEKRRADAIRASKAAKSTSHVK